MLHALQQLQKGILHLHRQVAATSDERLHTSSQQRRPGTCKLAQEWTDQGPRGTGQDQGRKESAWRPGRGQDWWQNCNCYPVTPSLPQSAYLDLFRLVPVKLLAQVQLDAFGQQRLTPGKGKNGQGNKPTLFLFSPWTCTEYITGVGSTKLIGHLEAYAEVSRKYFYLPLAGLLPPPPLDAACTSSAQMH